MTTVDLNSDLGEGFGAYVCGDDAAMLAIVTSANIACGFHAGDPDVMAATFATAKAAGVSAGAHPGYADLQGFGRRRIPLTAREVEHLVAYQVGAAMGMAALAGHRISHVKAHGALANVAAADRSVADAVARAVKAVDPTLAFLAIACSEQVAAGEALGLRTVSEIYADRGYAEDGQLAPRGTPGAVITDPEEAAARTLRMIEAGAVFTLSGRRIPVTIESVCVHGDNPHAVAAARLLRDRLTAAGLALAPFAR